MTACTQCQRAPMNRCLSHTTLPFGQFKGKTFDEVPLGYLDWLSGQSYVSYGWLRTRLTKYLTHPCIARELDEQFPDPDDDTRQPAFSTQSNMQRREPMPKEFIPQPDIEPAERPMSTARAWQTIADAINHLEVLTDPNDFLEIDRDLLSRAVQHLGRLMNFTAIRHLREAYRTARLRLQHIAQEQTPIRELLERFLAA